MLKKINKRKEKIKRSMRLKILYPNVILNFVKYYSIIDAKAVFVKTSSNYCFNAENKRKRFLKLIHLDMHTHHPSKWLQTDQLCKT